MDKRISSTTRDIPTNNSANLVRGSKGLALRHDTSFTECLTSMGFRSAGADHMASTTSEDTEANYQDAISLLNSSTLSDPNDPVSTVSTTGNCLDQTAAAEPDEARAKWLAKWSSTKKAVRNALPGSNVKNGRISKLKEPKKGLATYTGANSYASSGRSPLPAGYSRFTGQYEPLLELPSSVLAEMLYKAAKSGKFEDPMET